MKGKDPDWMGGEWKGGGRRAEQWKDMCLGSAGEQGTSLCLLKESIYKRLVDKKPL
jgi:hypothetical protein